MPDEIYPSGFEDEDFGDGDDPWIGGILFNEDSPWVVVEELRNTRPGTAFASERNRQYTRRFRVQVKTEDLGSSVVCTAPGIPRPFSPYTNAEGTEYDLSALCVRIYAEQQDPEDRHHWIVTAEYSTVMPSGGQDLAMNFGFDPAGSQHDPELVPPELSWEDETTTWAPQRDLDGRPFTNSADQPLTPAFTEEIARPVLVMIRNELNFKRSTITDYSFAVNADTFLGCPPGSVQAFPPRAKQEFFGPKTYWRVIWRFRFARVRPLPDQANGPPRDLPADPPPVENEQLESFQPEILDQGLCRLENRVGAPDYGKPVSIIRKGVPISSPVLLNGLGQPATTILTVTGKKRITPYYLKFRTRKSMPFGSVFNNSLGGLEGGG